MSNAEDLILAIDSGTQNVKAAVFDLNGNQLALSRMANEPDSAPFPRWVEHDPEDYWKKLCATVREVLVAIGHGIKNLKAVGLTSQRGTVIPMDKKGNILRPAIIYLDGRETEGLPPLGGFWGLFFRAIGKKSAIDYVRSHSRFLWIRQNEPEVYRLTHKFMQVASFLNYRLTGEINESIAMMVGMFPIDYTKFKFYPFKGIHEAFGVTSAMLPELMRPQSITGRITREASLETMIPEGLPVVVGGGDQQSAMIGMGVTDEKYASLVLGTTIGLNIPSKKYINDKNLIFLPWPSAIPGEYILEVGVGSGLLTVSWFVKELAGHEAMLSKEENRPAEEILEDEIRDIPPGSLGLMVQPYWNAPFHRPEARGSMLGFSMAHTRAHLYRAILEGMAYEIRAGYEAIHKGAGIELSEIRVSGGGSQSGMLLAILADVFGIPVVRTRVGEAGALGAAICAGAGAGLLTDFRAGIEKMVHVKDRFEPSPENHRTYEAIYRTYLKIYPRVGDLYKETEGIASDK
jgi:sugar (pentulose or hexulose) kinase